MEDRIKFEQLEEERVVQCYSETILKLKGISGSWICFRYMKGEEDFMKYVLEKHTKGDDVKFKGSAIICGPIGKRRVLAIGQWLCIPNASINNHEDFEIVNHDEWNKNWISDEGYVVNGTKEGDALNKLIEIDKDIVRLIEDAENIKWSDQGMFASDFVFTSIGDNFKMLKDLYYALREG